MAFLSKSALSNSSNGGFTTEPPMGPGRHRVTIKTAVVRPSKSGDTTQLILRLVNNAGEGAWANFGLQGGSESYRLREDRRLAALLTAVELDEIDSPGELKGCRAEVLITENADPVFIAPGKPEPEPQPETPTTKPRAKAKPRAKG